MKSHLHFFLSMSRDALKPASNSIPYLMFFHSGDMRQHGGQSTILVCFESKADFYGLMPVAFAVTGVACPPSADNFIYIYGFSPVELQWKIKSGLEIYKYYSYKIKTHRKPFQLPRLKNVEV